MLSAMRFALSLLVAASLTSTAFAETPPAPPPPPPNQTLPMTAIKDAAAACAAIVQGDPTAKCTKLASVPLKGIGNAEVYGIKGPVIRYAMVVTANNITYISPPVELMQSNCGMGKCDIVDSAKPTLKSLTIAGVTVPALVVEVVSHNERTEGTEKSKPTTVAKWLSTTVLACSGSTKLGPACRTYKWGFRDMSCKTNVTASGDVNVTCDSVEHITFE